MRDKIFGQPLVDVVDFRFDEEVAAVFPDMIERSVPGYGTVVGICAVLAKRFSQEGSHLYDLGCSLGATSLAMASRAARDTQVMLVKPDKTV